MRTEDVTSLAYKKVVLERMMYHSVEHIDPCVLEPRFNIVEDFSVGGLIASMRGYVWAEEIQDDTASLTVEWPATVWQAFKDRWFPRWALRRWPVKLASRTTTHRFIVRATLPEYKYVAPVESAVVFKATGPGSFRFRGDKPEAEE